MEHAPVVARAMRDAGFDAKVMHSLRVDVSLKNRIINTSEVETVIEREFGEIQFRLHRTSVGVSIAW